MFLSPPTGLFRRKTACPWWTNTKSTSALKPNWGSWRSSLASRIHPSPSKSVPLAPCWQQSTAAHCRPSSLNRWRRRRRDACAPSSKKWPTGRVWYSDLCLSFPHWQAFSYWESCCVEFRISSTCIYIYMYMDIKHWTLPQSSYFNTHPPPLPPS